MKTIQLKTEKERVLTPSGFQEITFSTLKLIEEALSIPTQGGYTTTEQYNRFKVLDAINSLSDGAEELILEDAVYDTLKACIAEFKPVILSRFIYGFQTEFA